MIIILSRKRFCFEKNYVNKIKESRIVERPMIESIGVTCKYYEYMHINYSLCSF